MNMNCTCHLCKKELDGEGYSYLVNYPLGLYELQFCCEKHRDDYIKKHTAEYYRGVPIYQQFNFNDRETVYMLDHLSMNYFVSIEDARCYINERLDEVL